jgi:uncharacterized membrane protein
MKKSGIITRFHALELMVLVAVTVTGFLKIPAAYAFVAHWGRHGQPDWSWPRDLALLLAPTAALICLSCFALIGWLTPKPRLEMGRHVLEPALTALLGIAVAVQFGLLLVGTGSDLDLIRLLAFGLAPAHLLLGVVLREAERHTYAGLRLPWAIRSERMWRIEHQLIGWLYILGGLVLAGLAWYLPDLGILLPALALVPVGPVALTALAQLLLRHR